MKVSYNWLNEYFEGKAPAPKKVEKLLTMHSMEVDSLTQIDADNKTADERGYNADYVLDVKTLPNNNHSCLCHRGIAREIGVLADLKPNLYSRKFINLDTKCPSEKKLTVKIEDGKLCRRYIGRIIESIKVGPSPKWLAEKLETLGQRSINNVVDATNFVMLEIGQPTHIFDFDKLAEQTRTSRGTNAENSVEIVVKKAIRGQKITTLDKKDVELDDNTLLITDGENPLAIAGVKGGNYAELEANTKNIILESANFEPVLIRKTAQKIKIPTEASKRYENDLTAELAGEAMDILTKLIVEIAGTKDTKVGEMVDNYPTKAEKVELGISAREASDIIGVEIKDKDIENIFDRFQFIWKKAGDQFVITVPAERLDLRIKEDLAEEIGRVYGYEKIKDIPVPKIAEKPKIDKGFVYKEKIRMILYAKGFSEVINYTFTDKGEVELANPMSPERKFLRTNLTDGIKNSLEFNARYSELVEMPQIKIFEFGHVFKKEGEGSSLALGVKNPTGLKKPKEKEVLETALKILSEKLGFEFVPRSSASSPRQSAMSEANVAEFDFSKMLEKLPEAVEYDFSEVGDKNPSTGSTSSPQASSEQVIKYKKISQFPFMIRDIAVFTPEGTKKDAPLEIINREAGELMIKNRLFDEFTKTFPDGSKKVSYAYRIIFQSYDRTLTDNEVNTVMTKITEKMNKKTGWQVR